MVGKPMQSWNLIPPSSAKAFPDYVPKPIRDDYLEACLIRDLSPKASATLSRRCLQGMIRDFWGIKKTRLVDEIEAVKDKMTYGKVRVTYNAYLDIVPNLTDVEKAKIIELLTQAREEAMDGGSEKEKSAIFKVYKNRVKAYLTANGHDVEQDYRDWGQRQKQATQPAAAMQPSD